MLLLQLDCVLGSSFDGILPLVCLSAVQCAHALHGAGIVGGGDISARPLLCSANFLKYVIIAYRLDPENSLKFVIAISICFLRCSRMIHVYKLRESDAFFAQLLQDSVVLLADI